MACSARHEVSRCSKSVHPTLSYALTAVNCAPFEASFQTCCKVLELNAGLVFTFSLIYHFSLSWIYSFLDDFADF